MILKSCFKSRWRGTRALGRKSLGRFCLPLLLTLVLMIGLPVWGQTTSGSDQTERVPVELGGNPIFYFRVPVAGYSPETRAKVTAKRIYAFARDRSLDPKGIGVVIDDQTKTYNLVFDGDNLAILTEADAQAIGIDPVTMVYRNRVLVANAINDWRDARTPEKYALAVLYTLAASLGLIVTLFAVYWGCGWLIRRLRRWQGTRIPGFSLLGNELLSAERIVDGIWELIKLARLVFVLLVLGYFSSLVLGFFPETKRISDNLNEYAINAAEAIGSAVIDYLPKLFFIGIIVLITAYVLKLVRFFFTEVQRGHITVPGFYTNWAKPTYNIIRVLIIFFAAAVAYPYLPGASSPAFQGISIFLGALFTLGSSGAIANLVSGVVLIYSRAYEIGDRICISDTVGDVLEKSLFVTRIRTLKNVVVTVPNSVILGSNIINYTPSKGGTTLAPLVLHTTVTLGYDVPWRLVHEVLISAAQATGNILEKPVPFVLQTSLDDFYVSYELNAYTEKPKLMPKTYSNLHQNIQDKCNEAGIEILSPHYRAARDGNPLAVPPEYWPEDYQVPDFRVEQPFKPLNRQHSEGPKPPQESELHQE
jgi:small-conductance mechanosensitive channel